MSAAKSKEQPKKTDAEMAQELEGLKDKHVECRTFGHRWSPEQTIADRSGITIELACMGCGALRVDRVNRQDGTVEGRTYSYPEGYRNHKYARSTFRFEFVRRVTTPGGSK